MVPGSRTASSASVTNGSPASGSENTATVAMSMARAVRAMRDAISPRLATRSWVMPLISSRPYIRKTPKPRRPWTGPECAADSAMPSTGRVSRGSMTPSS